ncbi:MAG: hypothetical protein U9R36_06160 [Elusimicrobiota bacterium]|nr:hypothetical protein [Elusimicrobiota bacterium]
MVKKTLLLFFVGLTLTGTGYSKGGKHIGERKMLDVKIEFLKPSGRTITNENGTFYHYRGRVYSESKVYLRKYWGEFPLYFIGRPAYIKVTVANRGPRAKAKVRIKTECYTLNTDGSDGMSLMEPKIVDIEVPDGQSETVDATFTINYRPGLESGLDRFKVKVLHMNRGGGKGNEEPALIMEKEGIFCPPDKFNSMPRQP